MVDYVFSNVTDITKYNPNAKWYLKKNGYAPKDASSLRPDTIRLEPIPSDSNTDEKVAYVLDAKFYRFGTTGNESDLPTTTSIQKQITYGEYVKMMKPGVYEEIYSAFVMPYSKKTNIHRDRFNKDIEFIGVARAKWIDSQGETNRNIAGILLDTKFLINNWVRKNQDNINDIIDVIENNIKGGLHE